MNSPRITIVSVVLAFVLACVLNLIGPAVSAQSIDRQNPTLWTEPILEGRDGLRGQSYFYRFIAGPGDVTVTLDAITDYYSTNLRVIFTDEDQRQLGELAVLATTSGGKKSARFTLMRRQPVFAQLLFELNAGTHVDYKIHRFVARGDDADYEPAVSVPAVSVPPEATRARRAIDNDPIGDDDSRLDEKGLAPANEVNKPIEDKWALIVGISKFNKPGVDLKYPAKDARDLYNYLITDGHFAPDHVKLLVDDQATKVNVLSELGDKWLPRLAHPNDLVLIYISSHGSPAQMDREGINYLVMHDTDPDQLYATGLPLQYLAETIKDRVHCDRVVVILDACHSGAADPAKGLVRTTNIDPKTVLLGTGELVICSSQPNQLSWESKRYPNGVFTHELIEALRSKTPIKQAFDRMKESVQSEVLQDHGEMQTPAMKSKWTGNALIISAPPTKPRSVPQELR